MLPGPDLPRAYVQAWREAREVQGYLVFVIFNAQKCWIRGKKMFFSGSMIRKTKDGVNVRRLYKYSFYLLRSQQIKESKVMLLCVWGGQFSFSHVQFFGVWKDKTFVLNTVWKGKIFVSKGVLYGKNCVRYIMVHWIVKNTIFHAADQWKYPFLFYERGKLCSHQNNFHCDFPPQLMHFNLLPELRERRSRITKPIKGLLNTVTTLSQLLEFTFSS